MADWTTPVLADLYSSILSTLKARDVDALTMLVSAPSNPPTGAMKYVRASNKFQEWDGAAFQDKILALAGGGTGGATASAARTSLGLGTMSTQDSSAVNISGGTLAGSGAGITSLAAGNITTGTVSTARLGSGTPSASTFLRGDSTWAIVVIDIPYGADQSADFTAAVNTAYNLTGSHTVALPTVVGNGNKIIILVMKGTGSWTIDPAGTETILGATTLTFDFGQYSSLTLKADANGGKWDVL